MNKRERTSGGWGGREKSSGRMSCKHPYPPLHSEPCHGHISWYPWGPIGWTCSGLQTLGWPQGPATLQVIFQSPEKEMLLGHWRYLHLHDRGRSTAEQLLVATSGDEREIGPGRHTGSISEPQRPRAFHRWGDGGPGRRTESEAKFPRLLVPPPGSGLELPQQAMERVSRWL